MKKKMIFKVLVCTIAILFLSAFTTQTNDTNETSQKEFYYEVEKLDENSDRKAILGTDSLDLENQLSEADYQTIQEFIHLEKFHIELDEGVYSAMPTNDLCVSIDDYRKQTGLDYQEDNNEYLHNYKALSFVSDNIAVMNDFAENGYGAIQEDGMMSIEATDFAQQSFIMNFHIGWFKMTFRTNYWGTALFGSFGLLTNFDSITDINALFNASSSELEQCFQDVAWNLISEGESYFGNVMLDSLTTAVNTVITIKNIVLSSNWIGRLITITKYILSHYAPGLLKGIVMILGAVFYQYETDVEIGLWWSNYSLLYFVY